MATNDSRIYTKLGDDGSTGLLFGGRTSKADPLIETIGAVDETVAALGLARAHCADTGTAHGEGAGGEVANDEHVLAAAILQVQRDLFVAGADLMANPRARDQLAPGISLLTADMVTALERLIDERMAARPLRPVFVVPGANPLSAALDMARCQVRQAERRWVACRQGYKGADSMNAQVGIYLNRVSDLLFVLARQAAGDDEEPTSHGAAPSGSA